MHLLGLYTCTVLIVLPPILELAKTVAVRGVAVERGSLGAQQNGKCFTQRTLRTFHTKRGVARPLNRALVRKGRKI